MPTSQSPKTKHVKPRFMYLRLVHWENLRSGSGTKSAGVAWECRQHYAVSRSKEPEKVVPLEPHSELLWAFSVEIEVQLVPPSSTSTCRLLTVCQCSLIKRYPVLECVTSSASKVPLNAHLRRTDWATGSFSQAKTHSLGTFTQPECPTLSV